MNDRAWNGVGIAAVVVAGAILALHLIYPIKGPGKLTQTRAKEEHSLKTGIAKIRDQVTDLKKSNGDRNWEQDPDQVAAIAMAKVTSLAEEKGLKVVAFRPQRTVDDEGVSRYPYAVSLEGPYPNVIDFVSALETHEVRLAVNQVQLAASDGASDKVSATVGLVAYRETEMKK